MKFDFLGNFTKRMKNVGLYAVLVQNIVFKTTWTKFKLERSDEQINLTFSVLLFIMDNSLRESPCTIDDIAAFLDSLSEYFSDKGWSFDECRELAIFIVNSVLSNDGILMNFDGFDYDNKEYRGINIRYLANEIVYLGGDVKRTSYYLTDDGYNLLLSTLEIENNMRLTIQELLFQMHLEKQSYDKAVDDIKEIFNTLRRQVQRANEAMRRIRRNALDYSVTEYEEILHENLDSIADSRPRFEAFREMVNRRRNEIEEMRISLRDLNAEELEMLRNLGIIGEYLGRVLDEHQRVLNSYFGLKDLYSAELESISRASMIRRFSLRQEIYDRIMKEPSNIKNFDVFLSPLFRKDVEKVYDPSISFRMQRPFSRRTEDEDVLDIEFDEEGWEEEQERLRQEKHRKYLSCMSFIFENAMKEGKIKLSELCTECKKDSSLIQKLIPDIDIFKEVMVELIKSTSFDIDALRKERTEGFTDSGEVFEAGAILLEVLDEIDAGHSVRAVYIARCESGSVVFEDVPCAEGMTRSIRCSEVEIALDI